MLFTLFIYSLSIIYSITFSTFAYSDTQHCTSRPSNNVWTKSICPNSTPMKNIARRIDEALSSHYPQGEVVALTRILATELLGISQMAFYLKDDIALTAGQQTLLDSAIERLKKHEPVQYILGYSHFCGLRFKVTPATLIPRPETSELVEWIASEAIGNEKILDIGTGSGCIAVSLARMLPMSNVTAWDISPEALAVAAENSRSNGTEVTFEQVDILTHEPQDEQFDIIVSNPPYIKEIEKENMEHNVLDWEPHTALFVPDSDPLLFYRTIAKNGLTLLKPGGTLYFEINRAHGAETAEMLANFGYKEIELRKDISGNDRMIKATRA